MEYISTNFIFKEKSSPDCYMWPITRDYGTTIFVNLHKEGTSPHSSPCVSFFLHDEQALINFKNKVQWAYEDYVRGKSAND